MEKNLYEMSKVGNRKMQKISNDKRKARQNMKQNKKLYYREMHKQVELYFCSMNYSRFGKMFWHSRAPNISPGWLDHQASLTLLPTSHVWAIWRVLPSLISFLAIWAICNFTWGFQPLSRLAASLTIGKSLLELWVTTFIPNWQTPLIFVRFTSKSHEHYPHY